MKTKEALGIIAFGRHMELFEDCFYVGRVETSNWLFFSLCNKFSTESGDIKIKITPRGNAIVKIELEKKESDGRFVKIGEMVSAIFHTNQLGFGCKNLFKLDYEQCINDEDKCKIEKRIKRLALKYIDNVYNLKI